MKSIQHLLIALCFSIALSFNANAAVITQLSGIDINGVDYTATFNATNASLSFNTLFDFNENNIFGEPVDGFLSFYDPSLLGDAAAVTAVAAQILALLGGADTVIGSNGDRFVVYGYLASSVDVALIALESDFRPGFDALASFQPSVSDIFVDGSFSVVTLSVTDVTPAPAPSPAPLALIALSLVFLGRSDLRRLNTI